MPKTLCSGLTNTVCQLHLLFPSSLKLFDKAITFAFPSQQKDNTDRDSDINDLIPTFLNTRTLLRFYTFCFPKIQFHSLCISNVKPYYWCLLWDWDSQLSKECHFWLAYQSVCIRCDLYNVWIHCSVFAKWPLATTKSFLGWC